MSPNKILTGAELERQLISSPTFRRGFFRNGATAVPTNGAATGSGAGAPLGRGGLLNGSAIVVPTTDGAAASEETGATMSPPAPTPDWGALPEPLRRPKIYLLWRYVLNSDSTKKPRKVPHYANGTPRGRVQGRPGEKIDLDSAEDRAQLVTLDEALEAWSARPGYWSGIGIALLDGGGVGAIDIDDCFDTNGKLVASVAVVRVIKHAIDAGCYIERSVSGTGLHIVGSTAAGFPAIGKFIVGAGPTGFEAYSAKRFLTMNPQVMANPGRWENIDGVVTMVDAVRQKQSTASARANGATNVAAALPLSPTPAHIAGRGSRIDLSVPSEQKPPLPETAENIARVRSALSVLDPDCPYALWRDIVFAVHSTQWSCAEELARTWSMGALRKGTSHE